MPRLRTRRTPAEASRLSAASALKYVASITGADPCRVGNVLRRTTVAVLPAGGAAAGGALQPAPQGPISDTIVNMGIPRHHQHPRILRNGLGAIPYHVQIDDVCGQDGCSLTA